MSISRSLGRMSFQTHGIGLGRTGRQRPLSPVPHSVNLKGALSDDDVCLSVRLSVANIDA